MTGFFTALFDLIITAAIFTLGVAAFTMLGLGIAGLAQLP